MTTIITTATTTTTPHLDTKVEVYDVEAEEEAGDQRGLLRAQQG